jgi:hypothetical protein
MLMNVLGYRLFRRVSPYVQVWAGGAADPDVSAVRAHRLRVTSAPTNPAAVYAFPPLWFLGLYQTQLGWTNPVFRDLAASARLAAGWTTFAALAAYLLSYKRHVTDRSKARMSCRRCHRPWRFVEPRARPLCGARWLQQAAFYFIWKTLTRSRRHKLLFAAYVAVGCALIFEGLAVLVARGGNSWMYRPIPELLPAPLILAFFILCGMRHVFAVPAELRANWVFRVSDRGEARRCLAGVKKAMIVLGVVPLFAAAAAACLFWGWRTALLHMLFGGRILLLVEVLLVNFEKFPFTCSYLPGKANLKVSWPIYLFGFTTYVSQWLTLEYWMLQRPARFVWLAAVVVVVQGALAIYRWRVWGAMWRWYSTSSRSPWCGLSTCGLRRYKCYSTTHGLGFSAPFVSHLFARKQSDFRRRRSHYGRPAIRTGDPPGLAPTRKVRIGLCIGAHHAGHQHPGILRGSGMGAQGLARRDSGGARSHRAFSHRRSAAHRRLRVVTA